LRKQRIVEANALPVAPTDGQLLALLVKLPIQIVVLLLPSRLAEQGRED
jgi:hypothetical protein